MTLVTLRPNATTQDGASITGAATAHAATNDNSDASYVTITSGGANSLVVSLGDLTLPAGAVIKSIALRLRSAWVAGATQVTARTTGAQTPATVHNISWGVATTTTVLVATTDAVTGTAFTDGAVDGASVEVTTGSAVGTRIYEVYVDVTYVAKPVVSVVAPTGTLTDTNLPTVEWSNTLDSDGGAQARFQVKVFTDAQYLAGGFDPDTSPATIDSGDTAAAATSWQATSSLADDTYRAYVRVAQTVNGVSHWSAWAFSGFVIDVDLPAAPTFTATADSANARNVLVVDDNAGTATTDAFEIQRSLDGGTTWETVRQLEAGEIAAPGPVTVYDYEAPNGVETDYRARALHDYSGLYATSDWVTDSATWTDSSWWLKHPHRPDLNASVNIHSFPEVQRTGRQGVFHPLGAADVTVVSDTRGPATGTVALRTDTTPERDALDALLGTVGTLLLQARAGEDDTSNRYIRVTGHTRTRVADKAFVAEKVEALEFVTVAQPTGNIALDDWP